MPVATPHEVKPPPMVDSVETLLAIAAAEDDREQPIPMRMELALVRTLVPVHEEEQPRGPEDRQPPDGRKARVGVGEV